MHELSLARAIVDLVRERADAAGIERVQTVTVLVGEWSAVMPHALSSGFDLVAKAEGGIFAGASLFVQQVPACAACTGCGNQYAIESAGLLCPACGAAGRLVSGMELLVDSFEGE